MMRMSNCTEFEGQTVRTRSRRSCSTGLEGGIPTPTLR
jgi:hypothetical protein